MKINEYADLEIGEEQVSSNECCTPEDEIVEPVIPVVTDIGKEIVCYCDLDIGEEQVTSNECFDVDESEGE